MPRSIWMRSLSGRRTAGRTQRLTALAALATLLAGCQGDALDPGEGITGPVVTLAPQTVSVTVGTARSVPLGAAIPVTVAANAGSGTAGITQIGATALVLNAQGAIVGVLPLTPVTFDQPQSGTVTRELQLRVAPGQVDLNALPDTLTYEVHGWVRTAGGACAAAVTAQPQRLPCTDVQGNPVAQGQRGEAITVVVTAPHTVAVTTTAPARLEARDVVTFNVRSTAAPGTGGIAQVGVAARVVGASGVPTTVVLATRDVGGRTSVDETITLTYAELLARLPAGFAPRADGSLTIQPSAFALHQTGACVAAVQNGMQQLPCVAVGTGRAAANVAGDSIRIAGVEGTTVAFPGGAMHVGDLLYHEGSQRLFVSNRAANTVEVLGVGTLAAGFSSTPARVGSRPNGLALHRDGIHVIVANSGGTNFSIVAATSLQEQRVAISRVNLYQIQFTDSTVTLEAFNYADRPQNLAQDAAGRVLYSAASTQAAPVGTIRAVEQHPVTGQWEARLLFPDGLLVNTPPVENRAVTGSPNSVAIANVDSMHFVFSEDPASGFRFFTGQAIFFDHLPGQPQASRASPPLMVVTAEDRRLAGTFLRSAAFGSDIVIYEGYAWNFPESVQMADTTFVASSRDHQWVAFGEGNTVPSGRVVLWGATNPALSRVEDIRDILNNSSDRISGIALNHDGTLGVAHGQAGAYFFDRRLRLQGTGGSGLAGGAGVTFLPGPRTLADERVVVGTGRSTLQVLDAVNFRVVREIPIRSNIVGQLRAAPCAPGAPAGCTATVYGVTADGIVAVNIPG